MFLSETLRVWKQPPIPRCSTPANIFWSRGALNRLNLPYVTFHLLHFQMCFRLINNKEYEINAHRQSWQLSSLPPPPYINVLHLFIHLFYVLLWMTDFCTKYVKNRSEKATTGKKTKYSNAKQLLKTCIFYIQIRLSIKKKNSKNFKTENPKYTNVPC